MRRNINYLLIAEPLTGDSKVMFYKTKREAKSAFNRLTKPFLKVCNKLPKYPFNLVEENDAVEYKEIANGQGMRFNLERSDELDELLGGIGNKYFEWGSVKANKNITHYFAEFSEWVDDSYILFFNAQDAQNKYETAVTEGIINLNDKQDIDKLTRYKEKVKRYEPDTWETTDGQTVFEESELNNKAFFGFNLFYYTVQYNTIELKGL